MVDHRREQGAIQASIDPNSSSIRPRFEWMIGAKLGYRRDIVGRPSNDGGRARFEEWAVAHALQAPATQEGPRLIVKFHSEHGD